MTEKQSSVIIGDANLEWIRPLQDRLRENGVRVSATTSSRELLQMAQPHPPDVIVLDDALDSLGSEVFISLLRRHCPESRIILLMPEVSHPDHDSRRHLQPLCSLVRPVSVPDLHRVISAAIHGVIPSMGGKRPPVILCVDDDAPFLRSLVRILRKPGYAVISYDNSEEALEAIPILQPDLAFIDVLMPGMNGLDLASEIREDYGDELPLVLLSARSSDREIADGYKSGATLYITKPCEPDSLLIAADRLLRRGRPGQRELLRPKT